MKRAKPSWATTNVTWETKKLIWKHWSSGETTSETVRYFEGRIDRQAVYSRDTIGKVRDELTNLPTSKLTQLLSEMPEIEDLVKELRRDYTETKAREMEQQSQHSEELKTAALIIASNLEKICSAPPESLGDPFGHTVYAIGDKVYGGGWAYEDRARLGDVDREVAAELLAILKKEGGLPELADINDWSELNDTQITEGFIQKLISRAHHGNF
jgi:hypothetical protein